MRLGWWLGIAALGVPGSAALAVLLSKTARSVPSALRCLNSTPDFVRGKATGYEHCGNGMVHRVSRVTCPSFVPREEEILGDEERMLRSLPDDVRHALHEQPLDLALDECRRDSDCTRAAHGHCVKPLPSGHPVCSYGCVTDSECPQGICLCGDPIGRCIRARCDVDDDCDSSAVCTWYSPAPGCFFDDGFACQTHRDECATSADCGQRSCGWSPNSRTRVCTDEQCIY